MPGLPQGELLGSEEVQANVSAKFEQACMDLKLKGERQRAEKAQKEEQERQRQIKEEREAPAKERLEYMKNAEAMYGTDSYAEQSKEEEDRDAILDDDTELDKLRQARKEQLKKKKAEYLENMSKGHGEYIEVFEEDFLKVVLASKFCVVHFFHNDFERCKIMDKHLKLLSSKHVEARFFKINAEKTPFFVEKLSVRTLPTLVFFQDGKAEDRLVGFQGLSGDEFQTRELEERIGMSGTIKMERAFYEDPNPVRSKPKQSIFASTAVIDDFEDPFAN
mmetsp:Transcript_20748/g.45339  ORF Transcript_20748/g.45339 Transcript_20748/m.45339 type:complete len:277 (-) Transcript_20748:2116-2946(-)|eukprot:CAMPEP_0203757594 /NCGR_PEP_ID=MMETSP0098-20131031/10585_1 /ASSEMBLY_ACC=CAM_ASM_000208 /TAXON_ID=96639 /ORGANISM=" , Strain NY0313808BC1" /LENGTH=276 /DNA_ID=CAMNT_0050649819 /DNA_START=1519 /DNA_END=2349 /DNA_ORIENTATION=-